jgi:hypothetical protein
VKVTSHIFKYGLRRPAAARVSSFLTLSFSPSSPSHPQGAVDKIVLPEGMRIVEFNNCEGITGTAESQGVSEVHIY